MEQFKPLIEHYSISNLGNVRNNNTGRILKHIKKHKRNVCKVTLTLENNSVKKDIFPISLSKKMFN